MLGGECGFPHQYLRPASPFGHRHGARRLQPAESAPRGRGGGPLVRQPRRAAGLDHLPRRLARGVGRGVVELPGQGNRRRTAFLEPGPRPSHPPLPGAPGACVVPPPGAIARPERRSHQRPPHPDRAGGRPDRFGPVLGSDHRPRWGAAHHRRQRRRPGARAGPADQTRNPLGGGSPPRRVWRAQSLPTHGRCRGWDHRHRRDARWQIAPDRPL